VIFRILGPQIMDGDVRYAASDTRPREIHHAPRALSAVPARYAHAGFRASESYPGLHGVMFRATGAALVEAIGKGRAIGEGPSIPQLGGT